MTEEATQPVEETEEESIWDVLGIAEPEDDGEEYEAEEEEAEVEAVKEDKLAKKLSARVDNLQKKFDSTMVSSAKEKFLSSANELEKDLFKTVSADIKDMESLARMATMVREKSKVMQKEIEKYDQEAKVDAAAKARVAWGVNGSPIGTVAPVPTDEEAELAKRIAKGDSKAAMQAMFSKDSILGGLFG